MFVYIRARAHTHTHIQTHTHQDGSGGLSFQEFKTALRGGVDVTGGNGELDGEDEDDDDKERFMTCWSRSWHGCVANRVWTLGFVIFAVGNGGDFIALGLTKASIVTLVNILHFFFFSCFET